MPHTLRVLSLKSTKIIATLGPASSTLDQMRVLIASGADCFRLNMSHGGEKLMQPLIDRAREAARLEGKYVPLLADIQGPKLRVGKLPLDGVTLHQGEPFLLTAREVEGNAQQVHSPYEGLARDVAPGTSILLADGTIELRVEKVDGTDVHTRVVTPGRLFSNKGLNLPGRSVSIATLTEKDEEDLAFAAKAGIDLIAISFVRSADDILHARSLLGANNKTPVMAKLERPEALSALDSILAESDGIMVARGDLGVEMPFERVPVLQKQILRRASALGKWAVVATQMLGSMVLARRPSRAEASDVANAVLDGADAVMLSEESATGANPELAVQAMAAVTRHAEAYEHSLRRRELAEEDETFAGGVASAAVSSAEAVQARAIVTLAGSGLTALHISKRRPRVPIVALGSYEPTLRRMNVLHGVVPVRVQERADIEGQLQIADAYLRAAGLAEPGDLVVMAAAVPLGQSRQPNTIRFHRVRPPGVTFSDPPPSMLPKKKPL
jgi:pyruvate kinase